MTKGIITFLLANLFLAACGAPEYEGREVGDEETATDGGTEDGDMSDGGFGNPPTNPATGGAAGMSTGGTGGNSGSNNPADGGTAGNGGSGGTGGSSGSSGSGGSGGNTSMPDPNKILSSLCDNAECLPDWQTGSFNGVDTGDQLDLAENRCGATNGCTYAVLNFDEFASCSVAEVEAHLGEEVRTDEVKRRFQRYADWARVQALICLQKCEDLDMTDEEVLNALCPPEVANFEECFRSVDPLTILAPSSISPAYKGFADHRCLDSDGVPVTIAKAQENVQYFLRAFRKPTAEQTTELKGKLGQEILSYFYQCFAVSRTPQEVR